MKVLAVGAHFDDVELGCGGTLARWRDEGHEISVFTATSSGYSDASGKEIRSAASALEEGRQAAQILKARLFEGQQPTFSIEFNETLNAKVLQVAEQVRPDVVLTHWAGDAHHDHRALSLSVQHGLRHVPKFLTFRSNWYDSQENFTPRFFVDISRTLEEKIRLIQLFESEYSRAGARWESWVKAEARALGAKIGCEAAEGFEVVRWTY